jgi:hypothetical protein
MYSKTVLDMASSSVSSSASSSRSSKKTLTPINYKKSSKSASSPRSILGFKSSSYSSKS